MTETIESTNLAIRVCGVTKEFPSPGRASLLAAADPRSRVPTGGTRALDHIDLEVPSGQSLGLIGPNGAGKSTLLRVLGGITNATDGEVQVHGRTVSLIELGLAFHPDLTGWENLPIAATLLGMTNDQLEDRRDAIVDFAGIRDLMGLRLKHFSTGMSARLGFALAVHADADVLLVDEVLAVGDNRFQTQCLSKVSDLVGAGMTLVFVSHALALVATACERAIQLNDGRIVDDGSAAEVIQRYSGVLPTSRPRSTHRSARLTAVRLAAEAIETNTPVEMTVEVEVDEFDPAVTLHSEIVHPTVGLVFDNADRAPEGLWTNAGPCTLSGTIAPLPMSAGTFSLVVELHEHGRVMDRRTVPLVVEGDQLPRPMWAIAARWSVVSSEDLPRFRRDHQGRRGTAVGVDAVTKHFRSPKAPDLRQVDRLRLRRGRLVALEDVDLSIGLGERVGLIGPNGAGKSTLLRIIAGVTRPNRGRSRTTGRLAAVLELGVGFDPNLTGAENLAWAWRLHGGGRPRTEDLEAVVDFAGLERAIHVPVKHFSTGMQARLAIALAIQLEPDLLLIDEALSTGDLAFRAAAAERVHDLCEAGTTLVFASHDLYLVKEICDRVVRLEGGRVVDDGAPESIIGEYGGFGWASGTTTPTGAAHVQRVQATPSHVGPGTPVIFDVDVEVIEPTAHAYLELSVRQPLEADERQQPRTSADVLGMTGGIQRIEGCSEVLGRPGLHHLRGELEEMPINGALDVVVSIIDEVDATVLSEQWTTVRGTSGGSRIGGALDAVWSVADRVSRSS